MRPSRMGAPILALVVAVVPFLGAKLSAARDVDRMAEAARALLASLSAGQRAEATFAMDSGERLRFHFIPPEMHQRRGITFGDMNPEQRRRWQAEHWGCSSNPTLNQTGELKAAFWLSRIAVSSASKASASSSLAK